MKTYISLLRGINVSGQNRIRMPALKELYESLRFINVATYVQSGNVVFDYAEQDPGDIAKVIEAEMERVLAVQVRVIMRDTIHLQKIIENNPFVTRRMEDPEKLHVTFLAERPEEAELRKLPVSGGDCLVGESTLLAMTLRSMEGNNDEFVMYDKQIYLFCPNGYGKTKFSNGFFERKLMVIATTRNWKTVNALYEMAKER